MAVKMCVCAGPCLQPGYHLFPATWSKVYDELDAAFHAVLKESRFAASSCCLKHVTESPWQSPEISVRGDAALQFDTGIMWRRASELLCARELMVRPWTHGPMNGKHTYG